ncbi:MAG: uncharacterized membrane protein YoaK (UPF0700 family) [Bacillariaceae sp.]|jgi:uncharacterized membrane protein YoaK (UPF0700 family)
MVTGGSKNVVWSVVVVLFLSYCVVDALKKVNSVATSYVQLVKGSNVPSTVPSVSSSSSPSEEASFNPSNGTIFPSPSETIGTTTTTTKSDEKKTKKELFLPISNKAAIGMGMILAFNSGVINCSCLSGLLAEGTKQGTAAITGAWTNSAIGAASMLYDSSSTTTSSSAAVNQFILNGKCILSYLGGSMISGLLIPRPKAFELPIKKSLSIFVIAFGILTGASILANTSSINYLFLCCLANGIQNSFTSTLTANVCRTCHFTGITSDMGTFLGQVLRGNMQNLSRLRSIFLLAMSFWIGGFVSFGLTKSYGSTVLFGSALIHLAFAVLCTLLDYRTFRLWS